jgi:hydroxymethylglutaryl-CoA reductase
MAAAAAMQASPHAPALSRWELSADGTDLNGELVLPIPLGTVGGLTRAHPLVRLLLERLELTSAARLCEVAGACGLAIISPLGRWPRKAFSWAHAPAPPQARGF